MSAWTPARARRLDELAGPDGVIVGVAVDHRDSLRAALAKKGIPKLEGRELSLLAFTDGLTEPENSFGEEIGEERLFGAARRALSASPDLIAQEIYREVDDWTGSPELQDDQTMIIAQAIA